jgi:hypothetical protein
MPIIRVELDTESFRCLTELAVQERRPIPWQAEVILIRALVAPVEGVALGSDTSAERVAQEVGCVSA